MCATSLYEFEIEARQRLDRAVYDFFAGGSDAEVTMRANEAAFTVIGLLPRVLCGAADQRELDITLLGCSASMPVVISPTAFHRLAHPSGEWATARAAAAAGVIMIVSMASTVAIENVAKAASESAIDTCPQLWQQLYIQPDLGFTESLVRRAEAAGCTALVVSVDSPAFGRRERDLRNGFVELPGGLCCENLRDVDGQLRSIACSPEISWRHIDWLLETTGLPIVLKGIMHPADARVAIRRGVDGIIVSNNGGRQLDTVPASIELLPAITDAVDGQLPVLLDGGIRRGTDVVKALALGASAVGIGRPVLWGLAVGGQQGVADVLTMLRAELDLALALCGCSSLAGVNRDLVRLGAMAGLL